MDAVRFREEAFAHALAQGCAAAELVESSGSDFGVGVRRTQEQQLGLVRPVHVVGVGTLAGEKALVFDAAHRLAAAKAAIGRF